MQIVLIVAVTLTFAILVALANVTILYSAGVTSNKNNINNGGSSYSNSSGFASINRCIDVIVVVVARKMFTTIIIMAATTTTIISMTTTTATKYKQRNEVLACWYALVLNMRNIMCVPAISHFLHKNSN